jgi:hypothetical protein
MGAMEIRLDNVKRFDQASNGREFDVVVRFSVICRSDRHCVLGPSSAEVVRKLNHKAYLEHGDTVMLGIIILAVAVFVALISFLIWA